MTLPPLIHSIARFWEVGAPRTTCAVACFRRWHDGFANAAELAAC